jgi:hypothetical protein
MGRTRGCAPPLSPVQVATFISGAAIIALALAAFIVGASDAARAALVATHSVLAAALLAAYLMCSLSDVSTRGGVPCPCMRATQRVDRYCRVCHTSVPGVRCSAHRACARPLRSQLRP